MELKKMTLENIGGGVLIERFDEALKKIIININDINTDPEETRSITLKLRIKPDKTRSRANYALDVQCKFAQTAPFGGHMYMATKDGNFIAFENNPKQLTFDDAIKQEDKND